MSGPSQPKVVGEVWEDERLRSFLELKPLDGTDPDYHVLRQAYEHMPEEPFARFVGFFVEAGRNINATGPDGETLLARISRHRRSQAYAEALKAAGAH
ncbi:PA4642 family protein [Hahella sp. SMD15-11]|uniref:PA4642 family protein n=1 Tax=Thermohahella caldifontis TaxID=3142973 RepID=A0AB39UU72_9GAMM